jgi:predicted DNA-binding transcriptional regulator YafY
MIQINRFLEIVYVLLRQKITAVKELAKHFGVS